MKTFSKSIYITFVIAIFLALLTAVTPVYAATSHSWTTQADFDAGVLNQVDTSSSPGDVVLGTNLDTGTGADGPLNVTGGLYFIETVKSAVSTTAYQGTDFIGVNTTDIFTAGDEVLIIQMNGTGAGNWETNHVDGAEEYVLVLHENLQHSYYTGGNNYAQVIRVPQYTDVTVGAGGILTCEFWNQFGDYTGGVMFFRATGTVTVENSGAITVTGTGSTGGTGGSSSHGGSGGSGGSAGGSTFSNPDGGDGGNWGDGGDGGDPGISSDGIAGYYGGEGGLRGDSGSRNSGSSGDGPGGGTADHGGTNASTADMSLMVMGGGGGGGTSGKGGEGGGGGGGGGSNTCEGLSQPKAGNDGGEGGSGGAGGNGGAGGGIIIIYADSIIANGSVKTNGQNGIESSNGGNGGSGGDGGYGAKFCVVSCNDGDCTMGGPGGGGGGGGGANGGNGGNSGAGGSGGTMWFAANSITISQGTAVESIGGLGGDAADGGTGSSGGSGGDGGQGDVYEANAQNGDSGPHGSDGSRGATGETGGTGEIRLDYCTLSGTTNPAPSYTSGLYYTSGTIASDVWDTSTTGETWQSLNWEATLHANSNIAFEVRASDTSFAKDASSPAWISAGSTSPVTSGLPSGRYMQWRATLTTNNTLYSPILHSVTISYSSSPDVSTDAATGITANAAALNGNLISMGTAAQADVSFEWGTTQGGPYPNSTPIQTLTAPGDFTANISGLTPDTPYYFRAKADGGTSGIDYGDEMSFTTSRVAPTVITKTAGNITRNSTNLNGNLHDMGTATTVNVSFEWGTTRGGPYPNSTSPQAMTGTGNYQANLSGLGPDTTYYYRAKADGGINGTSYGTEISFTTLMEPPSVTTDSATSITADSATLNGDLSNTGTAATVNVYFQWGTTQSGPYPNSTSAQAMTAPGDFNAGLTGLAADTIYYFRAVGDGGVNGTSYGDEMNFTTSKVPPSVSTTGATYIEAASATLNGVLNSLGTAPTVNVYFQWGTTQGGPYTESTSPQAKSSLCSFNAEINNLDGNTTYYFRAVGDGDTHGTSFGDEMSFTTAKVPPSVSTTGATYIEAASATLNGNLHSLGTAPTVGVSFQYGTTSGVYSNETAVVDKNSPCDFQSDLAGLNPDTIYYYRAKANGGIHGTSYGDEEVFTTSGIPPSVTTGNATDLTTNSAMLTGNLDALGTAATVDVSFRYGTTQGGPYPNSTTVQSMTATGPFQIGMDGLVPLTTYYFIARADGGTQGIAYGDESFFKTGMFPPFVVTDPATDPTDTTVNLNGSLYSLGSATTVNAYFEYGTTQGGPYPDTTTPQAMTTVGDYQTDISGLTPGTTYYYRAVTNGGQYGFTSGAEMSFTTAAYPPIVATNDASDILSDSATLNGNLDNLGDAATVNVSFIWGTTEGGPYFNSTTPQSMTDTGAFQTGITSLQGDTTYYYRAKGDGGIYGASYGLERNFTTAKIPPIVYTDPATSINPTTAVVNGYLSSMGTAPTIDVSLEWGTTQGGPYPNTTPIQTRNNTGYFGANITGLTPLTTYYFRALANGGTHGSDTGDELSFTTTATPPSVSTGSATAVTADSATLNGDLHSLGTAATVNVCFQWGTSSGVYNHETTPQSMDTAGNFNADLTGLDSDTTYYYRAIGDGGANGIGYGTEHSFTTNTLPPSVTTDAATDMTTDFARLNGTLDVIGTADTVDVSFIYGTTSGGPYPNTTDPQTMSSTGTFDSFINGLSPHTTYYYKAKADGAIYGTSYGAEMNFTTSHLPPVVETSHASDIITNAATLNGNLYNLGSSTNVDVSFEYGTTQGGPYSSVTTSQSMDNTGPFLADINGLTPETTYYFRAVADGGADGTSYGEEQMFTTSFFPPEVITDNANGITASSATLNGDLRFLGSATEANVSFTYGTTQGGPYPFVTTPQAMTATGVFNAGINGLSANTAYYFKAKADGGIYGTSYGTEMSFVTSAIPPTVTTGNADDITGAGAQLNGNLASLGSGPSAQVSFQWGTASGVYPNETTPQLMTGTGDFTADVTGLTPAQHYYYRAKAAGDGTAYGAEQSFWTSGGKDGVETATGRGMAYFSSNAGNFQNLKAVSDTTLPTTGRPAGMSFIYGLFSFDIVDITPGSAVTITIYLPGNLPTGTQYWDFINGQWVNLTSLMGDNNGDNKITLTITDGGLGDADGQTNGRISDPGGPANYAGVSSSNQLSSSSSSTPDRTMTMPANLSVKYLNVQPQRAQSNQKVVIYANITNSGDETSSYVAELKINGQVEQLKTGNVNGHAAVPLQFEVMKDSSGTYTVDINGQQSYFTVSRKSSGVETSRTVLQIALIFSAIAILSLAVLLIRRIKAD